MKKRMVSILLTAVTAASVLAGCGSSSSSGSGTAASTTGSSETASAAATEASTEASSEAATASTDAGETDLSKQDPYTVNIVVQGVGTDESCKRVAEAASKITEAKFNTTLHITRYLWNEQQEKVQNALASGEQIDLLGALSWMTVPSAASQSEILPLDDLLKKDGQGILADVPEADLKATSYQGQIYAIRNNKELAVGLGYAFDSDMLDSLDVDTSNIKTEADFQPILEAAKEKYPDVYPLVSDGGTMGNYMSAIDWLGHDFGVLPDVFSGDTTVVNWYTSDPYYQECKLRHQWVENGLIMPDPNINTESTNSLLGSGKGFAATTEIKPGIESQWERGTGKKTTVIQIVPDYSTTSNLNNYWVIPYTSKDPDRAMQVLNEIYTNPDLENILIYGVEGQDWEFKDKANGVIGYPDGVTVDDTQWEIDTWHWPNELIAYKWETDGKDIWDETKKFNEEATPSPVKGFVWDPANVQSEIVACQTVLDKYKNGLDTGAIDPDSVWDDMKSEYEAAGIDKIIQEKQSQLDAWLAENK